MSDTLDDQRTLEPTPRRRQRAREQGDVARSSALASAISWLVGLGTLRWFGPLALTRLSEDAQGAWSRWEGPNQGPAAAAALQTWLLQGLWLLCPLLLAIVTSLICAHVLQAGWLWLPDRLAPNLERLSAASAWQRMTAGETARSALRDFVQMSAGLGVVAWRGTVGWKSLPTWAEQPPVALASQCGLFVLDTALWAGAAWLGIGLIDYAWQWRRRELQLRMTPEEARQEAKEDRRPRTHQFLGHRG